MKTGSVAGGITDRAATESAPPLNERACLPDDDRTIGSIDPSIEVIFTREMIIVAFMNFSETCQPMLRVSPTNGSVFSSATNANLSGWTQGNGDSSEVLYVNCR